MRSADAGQQAVEQMTDFADARRKMVDSQLRTTDVTDHRVLDAMGAVAREDFVPEPDRPLAYLDRTVSLGDGRQMATPSTFALLVQLADPRDDESVLLVGAGAGYGAAVVARLASKVVALESHAGLAAKARANLAGIANVEVVEGPLAGGARNRAPFDLIIIDGAIAGAPDEMFDQISERGRIACVEGTGAAASAKVYLKDGPVVSARRAFTLALPSLGEFERKPAFAF